MNRRTFLRTLGGVVPAAMAASRPGTASLFPRRNWLWLHPGTQRRDDDWRRLFDEVRAAGIDAVLPEVFNGEFALFDHPAFPVKARVLEQILPLAHAAGLEVHAWMWTLNINAAAMVNRQPDWYAVNGRGEPASTHPAYVPHYKFLCPRRPEVRAWVQANVEALARIGELDGIHLDYVRLPDAILARGLWAKYGIVQDREYPPYDYCYCDYCRQLYRSRTGVNPLVDLADPATDAAWRQFRYDGVTELVNEYLVPTARPAGKFLTAAVFPHWWTVRQEWPRWQLDGFLPMLYHSFYEQDITWIGAQTQLAVTRVHGASPVYAGLFIPALTGQSLKTAVDSARAGGASGVALFSYRAMKPEHWQSAAKLLR